MAITILNFQTVQSMIEKDFNNVWNSYIKPLKGQKIYTLGRNAKNSIVEMTDYSLKRQSSTGKESEIKKQTFACVYDALIEKKSMTRDEIFELINRERASSIIVAILCKIPYIKIDEGQKEITLKVNDFSCRKRTVHLRSTVFISRRKQWRI